VIYKRHGENHGLPAARNSGIQLAQGIYIAYLDDDDLWLPEHLSKLVGLRMTSNCSLVYSDSYFWQDEKRFDLLLSEPYSKQNLLGQNLTPCCSILHDRSLFDQAGYFDESLPNHEDYDMWLRMSEYTDFEHLAEVTALYSKRIGSDQISMDLPFMATKREELQARHRERMSV
jgi:glycosyltransferase involved in cell wall biosynthesis